MNTKHIIGYILLAAGVVLIGYALFSSYSIFADGANPPEIFTAPVGEEKEQTSITVENINEQVESLLQDQLGSVLPQEAIFKTLNMFAWSVFAGLLMFGGGQLGGLGIKLLRIPREEVR